jgi:hypothetical protein
VQLGRARQRNVNVGIDGNTERSRREATVDQPRGEQIHRADEARGEEGPRWS